MLVDRRIGFIGEGRSDDFLYAGFARTRGQNPWINAVARDDSENLRRLQSFGSLRMPAAFHVQLRERFLQ